MDGFKEVLSFEDCLDEWLDLQVAPPEDRGQLVSTPVGQNSPEWVKTVKGSMLQSDRLKSYDFK